MKLCFSTLGCPEWGAAEVIAAAKKNKIDALELRGLGGELDIRKIPFLQPEMAEEREKMLGGIPIAVYGSSLKADSSVSAEETLQEAKEVIALCAAASIPNIRVFGNEIFPGEEEKSALAHIIGVLREMTAMAEEKGRRILLEVHGNLTTLERLQAVCDAIPSPAFGILWDIAHTDVQYKENYAAFYRPLLGRICHIHIKDHMRGTKGTTLVDVGRGEIPIAEICHSLQEDGYQGYFSLEWEKMWHPDLRPLEEELPLFTGYMRREKL